MATRLDRAEPPLIVIVGPTASGKTSLALRLAEQHGGEIVCADSRTIYRGLDIGTAKPSFEEQSRVKHWGIDLVNPSDRFTVADFQRYAQHAIEDIRKRGRVPILVGGTGLYVDAVIFSYEFPAPPDPDFQKTINSMALDELYSYCDEHNIILPFNQQNKRHVVNNILRTQSELKRRRQPIPNTLIVGIATEKQILLDRITQRAEQIWAADVIQETLNAAENFGWNSEAMTGNIYPLIHAMHKGHLSIDIAREKFVVLDRQLAKRQMTWFRRNPYTIWLTGNEAYDYCVQALNKSNKT